MLVSKTLHNRGLTSNNHPLTQKVLILNLERFKTKVIIQYLSSGSNR